MALASSPTPRILIPNIPGQLKPPFRLASAQTKVTLKTGTQTKMYPISSYIVIAICIVAMAAEPACSLSEISDGTCGQSDPDYAYTEYSKAAQAACWSASAQTNTTRLRLALRTRPSQ